MGWAVHLAESSMVSARDFSIEFDSAIRQPAQSGYECQRLLPAFGGRNRGWPTCGRLTLKTQAAEIDTGFLRETYVQLKQD